MKRRTFLGTSAAGFAGIFAGSCGGGGLPWERKTKVAVETSDILGGMAIEDLREDYRHRLFDLCLAFWEKGGYDAENGGFMTICNDDGTVAVEEKRLADQGKALWVYSFLYNNMGEDKAHLDIAAKTRDFMVGHLRAGEGRWYEAVNRDGSPKEDVGQDVTGWLYAAYGLSEYFRAAKNKEDQDIVFETLWAALREYDGLNYGGVPDFGGMSPDVGLNGLRELSHSTLVLRLLTDFLGETRNRRLEEVAEDYTGYFMGNFFNPRLGIMNEYLDHDFNRIAGYEDYMQTGNAVDAAWALMSEARRSKDSKLTDDSIVMLNRYLEAGWDYIFEGFGDGNYYVFDGPDRTRDMLYSHKTLRSHCSLMTGLLHAYEYTGEEWAKTWYERIRTYTLQKFAEQSPVWTLEVDRFGRPATPPGIHEKQRDIFHLPRYLMLDMLVLDRFLDKMGKLEDIATP